MKIMHTSDWHLGRSLYGKKRYEEYSSFLEWLARCITEHQVDALLVSGDIFDTTAPGNRAQELYYRFLFTLSNSCCRHVVITAGNHDSPTFLEAPKELLKILNVHVIGSPPSDLGHEIITLHDTIGRPEAVICAVPYLRDRDIRSAEAGETLEDKSRKLSQGIQDHYRQVCGRADTLRKELGPIPLIAMGHLFTAGGSTVEGDGVRELYVGSLAHVHSDIFPSCIDYLALGHLHAAQRVNSLDHLRYSGAPLHMGFKESGRQKVVLTAEFLDSAVQIVEVPVPVFQRLERISADLDEILRSIEKLAESGDSAWVEVEYTGSEFIPNLREIIDAAVLPSYRMEILRIKNKQLSDRVLTGAYSDETLDDLDAHEVFSRCLDAHEVPDDHRAVLKNLYLETLRHLEESDVQAQ